MANNINGLGKAGAARLLSSAAGDRTKQELERIKARYDLASPVERGPWRAVLVTSSVTVADQAKVRELAEALTREQLIELVVLLSGNGAKLLADTPLKAALHCATRQPFVKVSCRDKVVEGELALAARRVTDQFLAQNWPELAD